MRKVLQFVKEKYRNFDNLRLKDLLQIFKMTTVFAKGYSNSIVM